MRLLRYLDIIDLGVAVVVLGYLLLPPREIFASSAHQGSETEQFALALAEARTMAHPEDGSAIDELSRRLGAEGAKDWAIEVAVRGSERAGQSPTRWRALLAASVAYVDRLDVKPGLDYANRALAACDEQRAVCPSWEQIRMQLYQQHLDAGVKSGIDPHLGPEAQQAFRRAGESALRQIHVGGHDVERGATGTSAPTPSSTGGSGSNDR
jgi:hypothetical protein